MSALALSRQRHARGAALAAVCAVLFLTFLDNTIVSVALADVQQSLTVGVSGLQWIVDGYMLAFAGLMLTGGTLGDLLGRKKVMLAGIAVFCAGSLVGALALAVAARTVPESSDPEGRQLDLPGLALGFGAVLAATFAVIEGESAGYSTWWVDLLFALAAVAAAAFVLVEQRVADPVL